KHLAHRGRFAVGGLDFFDVERLVRPVQGEHQPAAAAHPRLLAGGEERRRRRRSLLGGLGSRLFLPVCLLAAVFLLIPVLLLVLAVLAVLAVLVFFFFLVVLPLFDLREKRHQERSHPEHHAVFRQRLGFGAVAEGGDVAAAQ